MASVPRQLPGDCDFLTIAIERQWLLSRSAIVLYRYLCIIFTGLSLSVYAQDVTFIQEDEGDLQQITGYVLGDSTCGPLPYAHILNLDKRIGKVANALGYFSIVAAPGDTLKISNIGYYDLYHVVGVDDRHLVIKLLIDVQQLPEAEVRPYPRSLMALRQDMKFRKVEDASTLLAGTMVNAGFKPPPTHPTPPPPTIMNPISFLYERVIKKIQQRRPKKDMAGELPPID